MGFVPDAVDRMSLWQFSAALDGYLAAHGQDSGLTSAERDRASALLDRLEGR